MKYFSNRSTVDLSKVDRERKLADILAKEALTNRNIQEMVVGVTVQLGAEDEEEEGGNPCLP